MFKPLVSTRSTLEVLEVRIAPATFTVTTTADSGPGSLRQAILDANAVEGADAIGFDIEGNQLQVITLLSPLPSITETLRITAMQSGSGQKELVRIDGTYAGTDAIGLTISSSSANGSSISGLQITNFDGTGMLLENVSSVEVVENSIFGNGFHGLHLLGGGRHKVYGNSLGSSTAIPESAGNQGNGLLIENSDLNVTASIGPLGNYGNSLIGNGLFGIEVRDSMGNIIAENLISKNGMLAPTIDQGGGIALFDSNSTRVGGAHEISIGGREAWKVLANVVDENIGNGILVSGLQTIGTRISGNTVSGTLLGNGIKIDGAVNTTFFDVETYRDGRPIPAAVRGNTISESAGWGLIAVNSASNITIRGSTFEDNASGAILFTGISNSQIGGKDFTQLVDYGESEKNIIHFADGPGIVIKASHGIEIWNNGFTGTGQAIDLNGDGATANDPGDVDDGANHLQNHPTLTVSDQQITAQLTSNAPSTKFRIEVYKYDNISGKYTLFAISEATTDNNGTAATVIRDNRISKDLYYLATATNLSTRETSEFPVVPAYRPKISFGTASIIEGDLGVRNLTFTVTLDYKTTAPIQVSYRTADNTAKSGEDYNSTEGTLVFAPGEVSKTITVPIFGDIIEEASESFTLSLSDAENGTILISSATGTIINDDNVPSIHIQDVNVSEGAIPSSTRPGYSEVQYTVTLSNPSLNPVTVNLRSNGGTATLESDYSPIDEIITVAPGSTSATKTLYIRNDNNRESSETIQLYLVDPAGGTLGNSEAAITIVDDDTWLLQTTPVSIIEGQGGEFFAQVTVHLVNSFGVTAPEAPISVIYSTENGTATAGSDFIATSGTLTFQPGEFEKVIIIPLLSDTLAEQNEDFTVQFSNTFGGRMQQSWETITIFNDDPGMLSVSSSRIIEGHTGQKILTFEVTLSAPTTNPVSVHYATRDESAIAGIDFLAVAGDLTFAPGETKQTISVPILADRVTEADETFSLELTSATGATISSGSAVGTILNDDPTISIENVGFVEGQTTGSLRTVYLPVQLSHASDLPVSLRYITSDGTAAADHDYVSASGTLVFAPGETLQFIALQIIGDLTVEPNEIFSVQISNPQGADIVRSVGLVTIQADEPFDPSLQITKNGRKASWTDGDGDLVILTASSGLLSAQNFQFGRSADGLISLQKLVLDALGKKPAPVSLNFSVVRAAGGDGEININAIEAEGRDLNSVEVAGRLGSIVAGDSKWKTPAVQKLKVNSFGVDPNTIEEDIVPLESTLHGSLGKMVVKHDFLGAHLTVFQGGIKNLNIDGNLMGISSPSPTGLYVQQGLKNLTVSGDIQGSSPRTPVEIHTAATPNRSVEAFHGINVSGNVVNTNLIAGGTGKSGVRAGEIAVKGDWIASNLAIGAGAGPDGFYGTEDDLPLQSAVSRIAKIKITGSILGTSETENSTDHFGFVAGRIAAFQVGKSKIPLSSTWMDASRIGTTSDVFLREVSGKSRF